jgi:hypothetical protein
VHPAAADTLAAAVLAALAPQPGDVALDLYCGAGLFAGVLAPRVGPAGQVIAVESDSAAVRDARHNLRAYAWARVHRGDAGEVVGRLDLSAATLVVLDPPRAGVQPAVTSALLTGMSGLRRIAYVSCDPATLARDLGQLTAGGWQLDDLRGFDAFPMTHHVECLATLSPAPGRRPAGAPGGLEPRNQVIRHPAAVGHLDARAPGPLPDCCGRRRSRPRPAGRPGAGGDPPGAGKEGLQRFPEFPGVLG